MRLAFSIYLLVALEEAPESQKLLSATLPIHIFASYFFPGNKIYKLPIWDIEIEIVQLVSHFDLSANGGSHAVTIIFFGC